MNKEKGFALVEVLLIALVVTGLGFGGYYVYNENAKSDEITVNETEQKNGEEQTSVSGDVEKEESDNLFTIPELGFVLSKEVIGYDDLGYDVTTTEDNTSSDLVHLYSEELRSEMRVVAGTSPVCNETVAIQYWSDDHMGMGLNGELDQKYKGNTVAVGFLGPCEWPTKELETKMVEFRDNVRKAVEYAITSE